MKLIQLILEGIGGYDDQKTFLFQPGLNIFAGPNEAGKSSLKRGAEVALVGFRSVRDRHMDSDQARVDARFETEDGVVRILRSYGKKPGGQRISESNSEAVNIGNGPAFEGVEPEVYTALFAIGLDELAEIGTKDWETIESRLVGHYASSDMVLPSEVLETLAKEMALYYRENGRGNFELKSVQAALRTKREQRMTALAALEAESGIAEQIDEMNQKIEIALHDAEIWQSRAAEISQRPDLSAVMNEYDWLTQQLIPQDDAILPDREAFEEYERGRQRLEAISGPENRAIQSSVRYFAGALATLGAAAGVGFVVQSWAVGVILTVVAIVLGWQAWQARRLSNVLASERHRLELEDEQFVEELPFQGPLAVEESLALLELRERAEVLRVRLVSDPDYARFKAWMPDQSLEEAQTLAMKARLEAAALENRRLTLELRSRRQEIQDEIEDAEREILGLERRQAHISATWNRLLLESLIVEEADHSFRSKRRYDFLTGASEYLKKLTGERYTAILARSDSAGRFMVEGPEGLKPVDNYLSRGTREQVYLALKLGLADALDPEGRWPVFLDDVAVNFDSARRRGFDSLIEALGLRRQVFYFTCREDLPERLADQIIHLS
jgi:uncharacterized protein YhaN